jgi:hypothetical protein
MSEKSNKELLEIEKKYYQNTIVLDMWNFVLLKNTSEDEYDYYYDYVDQFNEEYSSSAVV